MGRFLIFIYVGQSELMSQPDKDDYHEIGVDFNGLYPIMFLYEVKIVCKSIEDDVGALD